MTYEGTTQLAVGSAPPPEVDQGGSLLAFDSDPPP